ncbi:hypothetical protein ACFPFV_06930 [Salinicoccus siamensis]|uniref:hypothetical protein n=1 Tax=Salinicoccus siamensis TaxID=381830 RepID=UPI0036175CA9
MRACYRGFPGRITFTYSTLEGAKDKGSIRPAFILRLKARTVVRAFNNQFSFISSRQMAAPRSFSFLTISV